MVMLVARQGITGVHSGADAESLFPVRVNGVMNSEVCLHLVKERSGILLPGEVSERHFWLLIEISGMHSEKVINALRSILLWDIPAGGL